MVQLQELYETPDNSNHKIFLGYAELMHHKGNATQDLSNKTQQSITNTVI